MRYKLTISTDLKYFSDTGIEVNTKAEVDEWVKDNIEVRGLDYRVGYYIKFKDSSVLYQWVSKDNKPIKSGGFITC
mgnify:CR=1 FL=1